MLAWPAARRASNFARRLEAHQVRRLDIHIGPRDRQLHALVLADRPVEDDALPGVGRHLVDEPVAVADAFGAGRRRTWWRASWAASGAARPQGRHVAVAAAECPSADIADVADSAATSSAVSASSADKWAQRPTIH